MRAEPRSSVRTASLALAARIAIAAIAAGATVAAVVIGRAGAPAVRRYACPMHSEVSSSAPGDCPICGMALEDRTAAGRDRTAAGGDDLALAALRTSAEAASLLRFSVAPVRRNALPGEVFAPAIVGADGAIVARLYRDELATLGADEPAAFIPAAMPGSERAVRREPGAPVVRGALAEVGFRVANGAATPPCDQVGWIRLAHRSRDMLVVRSSAVLASADGPYVLVFSARTGTLTRRRIEVGKDYAGMTAVVAGLRDKEFVVMAHAFTFDAERRLEAGP